MLKFTKNNKFWPKSLDGISKKLYTHMLICSQNSNLVFKTILNCISIKVRLFDNTIEFFCSHKQCSTMFSYPNLFYKKSFNCFAIKNVVLIYFQNSSLLKSYVVLQLFLTNLLSKQCLLLLPYVMLHLTTSGLWRSPEIKNY